MPGKKYSSGQKKIAGMGGNKKKIDAAAPTLGTAQVLSKAAC